MTERVPKVRTNHRRNREEAARLQAIVDERAYNKTYAAWGEAERLRMKAQADVVLLTERSTRLWFELEQLAAKLSPEAQERACQKQWSPVSLSTFPTL